jgi:hypothetical protein
MSCFGKDVIRSDGYEPDVIHTATFSSPAVDVMTSEQEILGLAFVQRFAVEKRTFIGWKVCTRSYHYAIEDGRGQEILTFHWHPDADTENPVIHPHMHVGAGAGRFRSEICEMHFPTPRIAFEEFGLMLIEDFGVVPDRPDALQVLNRNLEKFRKWKSW